MFVLFIWSEIISDFISQIEWRVEFLLDVIVIIASVLLSVCLLFICDKIMIAIQCITWVGTA